MEQIAIEAQASSVRVFPLRQNFKQDDSECIVSAAKVINKDERSEYTKEDGNRNAKFKYERNFSTNAGMENARGNTEGICKCCGQNLVPGTQERTKAKTEHEEKSLALDFCTERRLIEDRRNAVCERCPHDRHELCAELRNRIVVESLGI